VVSACPYNILKELLLNITKQITYWKNDDDFCAEANRRSPALTPGFSHLYCFNYTPWRETTMPTPENYYLNCFDIVR
jgi:hypothetical protein